MKSLSLVQLFTTPWTAAYQAPPSMGFFRQEYWSGVPRSIESSKTRPGADSGSDHELLIAKFRFKMKKVRKTPRPFRYDLNQVLYDYTAEVINRFKGLDLIEFLMNYGWKFMTMYRRHGSRPLS